MHTQINSTDGDGMEFIFTQDSHYCAYFSSHPSSWRLWLADPLRQQLAAAHLEVSIDGKPTRIRAADFDHETLTIDLPSGLEIHAWKLEAAKHSKEPRGKACRSGCHGYSFVRKSPSLQNRDPVAEHMADAARAKRWNLVGSRAVDPCGVKNHHIGKIAALEASALWNRETTRRFLRDFMNSRCQREPSALPTHLS